jgi:hypothetical protein
MKMEMVDIVLKLIGPVKPIGETNTDEARFLNLENLCVLVENLICEIDSVACGNENSFEYSRKHAGKYARDFMTNNINIKD